MINITFSVDTSKADRLLSDLPGKIVDARKSALAAIGAEVAGRSTRAFRSEALRPSPWAPRKHLGDGHPLLIRSGALRQSIGWKLAGTDTVVVGTDKRYAAYHQHGTKKMPARPFFPIDAQGRLVPAMERKIESVVRTALDAELAKKQ